MCPKPRAEGRAGCWFELSTFLFLLLDGLLMPRVVPTCAPWEVGDVLVWKDCLLLEHISQIAQPGPADDRHLRVLSNAGSYPICCFLAHLVAAPAEGEEVSEPVSPSEEQISKGNSPEKVQRKKKIIKTKMIGASLLLWKMFLYSKHLISHFTPGHWQII